MKELCEKFTAIKNNLLAYLFPKEPIIEHLESLNSADFLSFITHSPAITSEVSMPETWIYHMLSYRNPHIEKVIHEIKYYQNSLLAAQLAILLCEVIYKKFGTPFHGTIIPLPPRKKRLIEYGFDQNTLITNMLQKELLKHVQTDVLLRNESANFSLTKMKRAQRLNQKENLYQIRSNFEGSRTLTPPIILYDDVTTTGSSLESAKMCLIDIGVPEAEIHAITLAH